MSSETHAWGKCESCGAGPVAVKKNRSGLAYYNCDHCGVRVQHQWHKTSDKLLRDLGAPSETPPAAQPEQTANPAPEKTGNDEKRAWWE